MYDVIIVGGSTAGLSAALVLGRFRRRVLICDQQKPRNAPVKTAHNFFTRDGTPPSELLQIGREQLRPYQTVTYHPAEVAGLSPAETGFVVTTTDGTLFQSGRVLLATGVRDELPAIPGLEDYWGKAVHHCPYCHGWEARDQKIVIIGNGEVVYHLAVLLSSLSSDIAACLYGEPIPTAEQMKKLKQLGVTVYDDGIESIEGNSEQIAGVRLSNGRLIPCQSIFVRTHPYQHSTLAHDSGCEVDEHGYVKVDELGRTSVKNL
ncbi:MAG: NAD(P)/FAD-dependent oxidoreductase, partial [Chloroflexota bacterium]